MVCVIIMYIQLGIALKIVLEGVRLKAEIQLNWHDNGPDEDLNQDRDSGTGSGGQEGGIYWNI